MKLLLAGLVLILSFNSWSQSSMRRCTLLPITDSVGGAIAFKIFEEVEAELKRSNWCTYVSNSGLINIFSKYRENLPHYLKQKEVIATVAEKLKVGSLIRITITSEIKGIEVTMDVVGEDGEDIYFRELIWLEKDDIDLIAATLSGWLAVYSKIIPYDAKINGILGEQLTLDVGKGYPIQIGQTFVVKRPVGKKRHPLLKKIVDWETVELAEGKIFNISDNQALGMVKVYKTDNKLKAGDWVRLDAWKQDVINDPTLEEKKDETPGSLGVLSVNLFGSNSTADTTTPTGSNSMAGTLFGLDVRAEAWITRQYFAAIELARSFGTLNKVSGTPAKSKVGANNGAFKLTGGYKYLPIGFFYGPQVDIYGGFARHTYSLESSAVDGFGSNSFSGIVFGVLANVPINRDFRFVAGGEFMPFPAFKDDDGIYGGAKNVSSLEFEVGMKYQYTTRVTLDGTLELASRKAKFNSGFKEISYRDNVLKFGASFNF